jgi:GT2 family glycosyltransferase
MISIIIVHYKVKKELITCISSILKSKNTVEFEIIVVDNDEKSKMEAGLQKKFSQVKYIKSPKNVGFGAGNNLGAQYAQGEYLFFLNPDTKILDGTLDNLCNFFVKNTNAGIVSPVFLDDRLVPFKSQGSKELTPKTILFSESFLRKIFPGKNIYKNNEQISWDMKNPISVDAVPGAAMMISSSLFNKLGGFDQSLFLYFEENDISKRVSNLGYKLFIVPSAKIIHLVGRSTKNFKNIENIYEKSRYSYVKKHYGLLNAMLVKAVLSINKTSISILMILVSALLLRTVSLDRTMSFIGDQGWFYLSARDMILNGQIPLAGIASSHPWLHQGPIWTYILGVLLWAFKFNPLAPGYFVAIMGVITVFLTYKIGSAMFSKRIGIIASFLYATSPLIIQNDRMPYHTSLIPLFTLLFIYSIYRWMKGDKYFFSVSLFLLAVLYNFEIQTALLLFVLAGLLGYGIWKRTKWMNIITNIKIILLSIISVVIPMVPMLIYDVNHGFPQTLKFGLWVGYRIARIFGFPGIHGNQELLNSAPFIPFSIDQLQKLVFSPNFLFTALLLLGSFLVTTHLIRDLFFKKENFTSYVTIYLILIISGIGYFATGVASGAYFPLIFPSVIFMLAIGFDFVIKKKHLYLFGVLVLLFIGVMNGYVFVRQITLIKNNNVRTIYKEIYTAKEIIKITKGREYNILGKGPGSEFESLTMNYEYLAWWLGKGPSKHSEDLKIYISELPSETKIEKILLYEK